MKDGSVSIEGFANGLLLLKTIAIVPGPMDVFFKFIDKDNLFVKELQTIPLILKMYIWKRFTLH